MDGFVLAHYKRRNRPGITPANKVASGVPLLANRLPRGPFNSSRSLALLRWLVRHAEDDCCTCWSPHTPLDQPTEARSLFSLLPTRPSRDPARKHASTSCSAHKERTAAKNTSEQPVRKSN